VVVALAVTAGCSSGDAERGGGSSAPDASFERATSASLRFEEPVATVADMVPPAAEGGSWQIAGSVFDPRSSTSTAATWASDDGRSWEREDVEPDDSDVSESFAALATLGERRLAVGWAGDGAESDAAVWQHGEDGWARVEAPEMGGEHEQWAFDAAAGEGGVVVAGGESVWGEIRARIWFSADGESWEVVDGGPGGPFDATGQESVREVAAIGTGFVAVGTRTLDNEQDGIAWYSADGQDWQQVEAPSLGGPGRQALLSVSVVDGVAVAGGYSAAPDAQGAPVVWRSNNGQSWGAGAPLGLHGDPRSAAADITVRSVTAGDTGLIASGGADWRPHIWQSTDQGSTWTLLPNPVARGLFEDGVALETAATAGGTTLALGLEPTVMRLDGDRWQDATGDQFPDGGVQPFATSVAVGDSGPLVAGGRYSSPDYDDPEGENRERYVGQVWNRGGDGFTATDTNQLRDGQVMDVAAYAGGYVAVGFEDFGLAALRTAGDPSPDGLIWRSDDGAAWNRVASQAPRIDEAMLEVIAGNDSDDLPSAIAEVEAMMPPETLPPAGGQGTRSLEAVAPLGDGFIAVGVSYLSGDGEPVVVVSPDGQAISGENAGLGGPGTQRLRDVCVSPGGRALAIGTTGADGAHDIAVRLREPGGTWAPGAASDGTFEGEGSQQAYGCAASSEGFLLVGSDDRSGDTDARVWASEDGLSWERIPSGTLGGAGDQWASAVAAVPEDQGAGWLIGGTDTSSGDGDAALWRLTPDRPITRRDRGEPELGGPGEQSVTDLEVSPEGVVVVGDDYGRVGLWQSDTLDR
jgi:hypothetical protein